MFKGRKVIIYLMILCFSSTNAAGQIDSLRSKFIEVLSRDINKYYVSAKLARQMTDYIQSKYKSGGYDSSLNSDEFSFEITQDLRRISNDNHISITPLHYDFYEDSLSGAKKIDILSPNQRKKLFIKTQEAVKQLDKKYKEQTKNDMFDYGDIKIMPGNIGYVEIFDFGSTHIDREHNKNRIDINSVFNFLKNTNSIIIDLRENTGGLTGLAAKFCSYFSLHPSNYFITTEDYIRYDSSGIEKEVSYTRKYCTDKSIPRNSINEKAVYILVSNRTFSAAELVAYKIKQFMPKTLIIGEKTKGGGNGYFGVITSKYYSATIPSEKMFDESNASYTIEGKGITPDISTVADSAFNVAYRLASNCNTCTAEQQVKYFKRKEYNNQIEFEKYFLDYQGNYRKINVYMDSEKLYMIYDTFKKYLLSPVQKDFFLSDDFEFIHFVRNNNMVIGIEIKHKDGYTERFGKL